jgi:hypothetical protein
MDFKHFEEEEEDKNQIYQDPTNIASAVIDS